MTVELWWLLGGELALICTGISLAWAYTGFRKKKQASKALAQFLENLDKAEAQRSLHYNQWLKEQAGLGEEDALVVVNELLETEKRFWRTLVYDRLAGGDISLPDLVIPLHKLLDDILDAIGKVPVQPVPAVEEEESVVDEEPTILEDEVPESETDTEAGPPPEVPEPPADSEAMDHREAVETPESPEAPETKTVSEVEEPPENREKDAATADHPPPETNPVTSERSNIQEEDFREEDEEEDEDELTILSDVIANDDSESRPKPTG